MDGQNFLRDPFYNAKARLIDHIWPVRLQFTCIAKQQIHNYGFRRSILSGQLWSSSL